mgnify:CR=1 FL=1
MYTMREVRIVVPDELDRVLEGVIATGLFSSKAEVVRAALIYFLNILPTTIGRGYDVSNIFSPEGRVLQLEYALEAAKHGAPVLGIKAKDGIILAAGKLEAYIGISKKGPSKIRRIGNVLVGFTGLGGDAEYVYSKIKPQEKPWGIAKEISRILEEHAVRHDVRPLGVVFIIGGIEEEPKLYVTEPSGTISEYEVACWGKGYSKILSLTEKEYSPKMTLEEAEKLAVKVLTETGWKDLEVEKLRT